GQQATGHVRTEKVSGLRLTERVRRDAVPGLDEQEAHRAELDGNSCLRSRLVATGIADELPLADRTAAAAKDVDVVVGVGVRPGADRGVDDLFDPEAGLDRIEVGRRRATGRRPVR